MAMTQDPSGRMVWVPDGILAPPQMDPLMASTLGPRGTGQAPFPVPPPPPPPPPPVPPGGSPMGSFGGGLRPLGDRSHIGQGAEGGSEVAGEGIPSVTGGMLPDAVLQHLGAMPSALPVQSSPDQKVATIDTKALEKEDARRTKAAEKEQAAQAKFDATPEGQARIAAAEGQSAIDEQKDAVRAQGAVDASEQASIGGVEQEGLERAEGLRQKAAADAEVRRVGTAEKLKAIDTAVKAEADFKVDDNRRWKNMGTGKRILAAISIALSGLGDALMRKSGPNAALGIIQGAIHDDVEAQVRERDQMGKRIGFARNSLDNYRQITNDMNEAAKLKISEEYERTAQQIRVTASKYGSDKAKLRAEALAASLSGQAANLRTQSAESAFNRDIQREQMRNAKAQVGIAAGHLSLARQQFEFNKDLQTKQMQIEAAKLEQTGKGDQAKALMERGIGGAAEAVKDENGNIVGVKQEALKNADGSTFIPTGSIAAVDKLRDAKAATDTLLSLLDEAKRIRTGWTSDTANSDEFLALKANWAAATGVAKDLLGLGALSGPDMELVGKFIGTADPTGWKDPQAGITKARGNILTIMNSKLAAHGYSGKYDPKPLSDLGGPQEDAAAVSFKGSVKDPGLLDVASAFDPTEGSKQERFSAAMKGILPATAKEIQSLSEKAQDSNLSQAQRDAALARLKTGADKGGNAEIKAAYQRAWEGAYGGNIVPAPRESVEPTVR